MSYNVKLDVFEGPLDLLLFFIKRDEINIYDIPISHITNEYLEYLELMKSMNLHLAGEFILMASLLIRIKVRMLLPRKEVDETVDVEDPRTELVEMLLEYKKYKDISNFLRKLETDQLKLHQVNSFLDSVEWDPEIFLSDVNLLDMGIAFKKLLINLPKPSYYEIETYKININQQIQFINSMFLNRKRIRFSELAQRLKNRIEVLITFLAILEMIKNQKLRVSQKIVFGDFWLTKLKSEYLDVTSNA
ncbi:MAG: segregation/condensation protein A [Candidatus Marinimicrobia bacterium]|nr:segregation/condensation protein A [Candidatus Neomarinimicrobiota bacterium]